MFIDSAATGAQLWPPIAAAHDEYMPGDATGNHTHYRNTDQVVLLDVLNVQGPDEYHVPVNTSAYTNVVAARALVLGATVARILTNSSSAGAAWLDAARRIGVIFDGTKGIHPEFRGWTDGDIAKQADTVMLGFPLEWPGLSARNGSRSQDL